MITVMLVNNGADGFASHKNIDEGTSVSSLFRDEVGGDMSNYLIRVNRQSVDGSYLLKEGDRVTLTPTKIEGA